LSCLSEAGHHVDGVKENSLLSVSGAVREVGALGSLSKCGICRSLGFIAFCSSERNGGYFGGFLLTESSTEVLKTQTTRRDCCWKEVDGQAEFQLSLRSHQSSETIHKRRRDCSVFDVSFRLAFPFLNLSTTCDILH
jgi:hypothetical protein